jgi:hypothetical protein
LQGEVCNLDLEVAENRSYNPHKPCQESIYFGYNVYSGLASKTHHFDESTKKARDSL